MLSRRKHAAQHLDVGGGNPLAREEELLKLTKARSLQDSEIKAVRASIQRLELERA